jgi:membrane protease YdiL (CAAX protease family)
MLVRITVCLLSVVALSGFSMAMVLRMPPNAALLWTLILAGGFLGWHFRRTPGAAERRNLVRLQRPVGSLGQITLASAATLLGALGISGLIEAGVPAYRQVDLAGWERLLAYQSTLPGWIAVTSLAVLFIPLVEEFCFRGYIQHSLEYRYPVWIAIGLTSLLFMSLHLGAHWTIFFVHLSLGFGMGTAVSLFGSVWVAVGIHAAWNATMATLGRIHGDPLSTFGDMAPTVLLPISILLLGGGFFGWYLLLREGGRRLVREAGPEGEAFIVSPPRNT